MFLTPEEIEELFELAGLTLDKIVKVGDGDMETEETPVSIHPVYYVRHKVDNITGTERETLTVWHWEESGGESQEWDKQQYDIQAGEIVGPWGICLDPVGVVKWFIMHGFYFEGEGTAAGMVARERVRQAGKGYTTEHDDMHTDGSLMRAATCFIGVGYAMLVKSGKPVPPCFIPKEWPWEATDWKTPDNPLEAYVIACAMMCAEIDRITRIVEARAAHEAAILPAQLLESLKAYVREHYPNATATHGPGNAGWHVWSNGQEGCIANGGDEAEAWDNAAKYVTARRHEAQS